MISKNEVWLQAWHYESATTTTTTTTSTTTTTTTTTDRKKEKRGGKRLTIGQLESRVGRTIKETQTFVNMMDTAR